MEDPKQEKAESEKTTDELLDERQSDATSDETIKKLEESRTTLDPSENNSDGAISPDGAFDESKETGPI